MGQNVNSDDVNASNVNESERPLEPFKYDFVEYLKHMPPHLHVLDLLQMPKETRENLIRELQSLDTNNEVHVIQVHQIEKKHQITKSKRP